MTTNNTQTAAPVAHTPGPWRAYSNDAEGLHILAGPVAGEESHIVCEHVDSEATAALIIAAPDLLAALTLIAETGDAIEDDAEASREAVAIARAALARAKAAGVWSLRRE